MFTLFASLLFCLLCFALTRLPASVPLSRKVLAGLLLGGAVWSRSAAGLGRR
ncbi:hypothetical protein ACM3NY_18055 [Aeromonas veronii]|uniref:hypothetical protein n=1 Tax=Aeromonas veronii TaxID=654 RepID=UPI0039F6B6BC